jgi:hypothetical protein
MTMAVSGAAPAPVEPVREAAEKGESCKHGL